jgi:hypothetical protein
VAQFLGEQPENALDSWQFAAKTYAEAGDEMGVLGSEINLAQALQTLGLYGRAKTASLRSDLVAINPDLQFSFRGRAGVPGAC